MCVCVCVSAHSNSSSDGLWPASTPHSSGTAQAPRHAWATVGRQHHHRELLLQTANGVRSRRVRQSGHGRRHRLGQRLVRQLQRLDTPQSAPCPPHPSGRQRSLSCWRRAPWRGRSAWRTCAASGRRTWWRSWRWRCASSSGSRRRCGSRGSELPMRYVLTRAPFRALCVLCRHALDLTAKTIALPREWVEARDRRACPRPAHLPGGLAPHRLLLVGAPRDARAWPHTMRLRPGRSGAVPPSHSLSLSPRGLEEGRRESCQPRVEKEEIGDARADQHPPVDKSTTRRSASGTANHKPFLFFFLLHATFGLASSLARLMLRPRVPSVRTTCSGTPPSAEA